MFILDIYRTHACLIYPASVIAIAGVILAASLLKYQLPPNLKDVQVDLNTLNEEQRREIDEREAELKRISALREAERVEFVRRQKEFQAEANRRETELLNREQLTESERIELENLRFDLQKKNIVKEIELKGLIERREELLREAERREQEINQRLNLTAAE